MRHNDLDIAKGISLIFILMAHSCGFPFGIGEYCITYFVAVFFVISGYLQSDKYTAVLFIRKRILTILVPYFLYNLFILLIYSIWHGFDTLKEFFLAILGILYSNYSLYYPPNTENNIFFYRIANDPTWFLTAFFCANILFLFYIKICRQFLHKISFFLFCLAATMLLTHFPVFLLWNTDKAFIGTAFMIIGYEMKLRRIMTEYIGSHRIVSMAVTFIALIFYRALVNYNPGVNMALRIYGGHGNFSVILFVCAGSLGSLICIMISRLLDRLPFFSTMLAAIGREGLAILSMHLILFRILDTMWINHLSFHYWLTAMLRIALTIALIMYTRCAVRHIRRRIYDKTGN